MNFPEKLCVITEQITKSNCSKNTWKPLVLVIPLRLGISTINPAYVQGLKVSSSILFSCFLILNYYNYKYTHISYIINFFQNDILSTLIKDHENNFF